MSTPINPLTHPLAQIQTFAPHFEGNNPPDGSGGSGDTTGTFPAPGPINTGVNPPDGSGGTPPYTGGNPNAPNQNYQSGTQGPSIGGAFSWVITTRFVLFLIGIILIIAGLYMLKPGPVTNVLTAPIRAAKQGIKTAAEVAPAAA